MNVRVYGINFYFVGFLSFFENVFKIIVKDVFLFVVYKEVFKLLNDYNVFFLKKKFGILILEK